MPAPLNSGDARANYLFDYTNSSHQGYMTDPDTLELLERLQFEAIRLGSLLQNAKTSNRSCATQI